MFLVWREEIRCCFVFHIDKRMSQEGQSLVSNLFNTVLGNKRGAKRVVNALPVELPENEEARWADGSEDANVPVLDGIQLADEYRTERYIDLVGQKHTGLRSASGLRLAMRAPEVQLGKAYDNVYEGPAPPQAASKPWPITAPMKTLTGQLSEQKLESVVLPLIIASVNYERLQKEQPRATFQPGVEERDDERKVLPRKLGILDTFTMKSECQTFNLLDQPNIASGLQNEGANRTLRQREEAEDMPKISEVVRAGAGFTVRTFSLFGCVQSRQEGGQSPFVRITILAGAESHLPDVLSFNWSPQEYAGFKQMIAPAHFLYDQVFDGNEGLINININVCNLRLGGSDPDRQACIKVYLTSLFDVRSNLTVFMGIIPTFIPALSYPLSYDTVKNVWYTRLTCAASEMETTWDERFDSGMYWPVAWNYRLASTVMLMGLPGVADLLQKLGKQALTLFPPSEKETMHGADIELSKGRLLTADERIAGGDPAMGVTNFSVSPNHLILGYSKVGDRNPAGSGVPPSKKKPKNPKKEPYYKI